MKYKVTNIILPVLIVVSMWICCDYVNTISTSIQNGVSVCLNSIVPSMYAFIILSDLLVKTNSYKLIGRVLSPISRYVLHLEGNMFAIFLISLVAGYPVGAKLISNLELNNSIDSTLAKKMYCYCYSGGLAFILGTIGGSLKISLIVYVSNVMANLILAMILNFKDTIPKRDTSKTDAKISSSILIDAINSSFRTIVNICVMIIAFSIVISLLDAFNITNTLAIILSKVLKISSSSIQTVINAILEVSKSANVIVVGSSYLPILSMIFSFGGICVVMQILSISGKSFNLGYFLKCRLFTASISYIICKWLSSIFLNYEISVNYIRSTQVTKETSIIPSICLLCMSFILLSKNTRHIS